ncbi:multi-sensor signal transduction histidine kinase [Magnetococcus marinus MC-1]|uniref:histidine kinase n=1 Tax=Magnetococcus marinus (strain ATCC BAA-1437 / JCM 17883 / MC-1) TaxID=156889 RepID=A0L9F0_MAGMM|nr:PAS domain S-box protein [Magnetococcus marinus]ABK44593.1 multi-sensor signal transduction histidine kinase [Magnetococcus marinus MC-1]
MNRPNALQLLRFWQQQVPLSLKVLVLLGMVGVISWNVLDHMQNRWANKLFTQQLEDTLERRFSRSLTQLKSYLRQQKKSTQLFVQHAQLVNYLRIHHDWGWGDGESLKIHQTLPPWLPSAPMIRDFTRSASFLLLDENYHMQELFLNGRTDLAKQHLSPALLDYLREGGPSSITQSNGVPLFVVAEPVQDAIGETLGVLALILPLDDRFLIDFTRQFDLEGIQVFVDELNKQVIASSDPHHVPAGSTMQQLAKSYLFVGQDFFNYAFSSEITFHVAALIPRSAVDNLRQQILNTGRTEKVVSTLVFIATFLWILFWLSGKLKRLSQQINLFYEQNLGVHLEVPQRGDQLFALHHLLSRFSQEITRSREGLTQELTERKRTEKLLRESEFRYRNLLENITDWVWELDEYGTFSYSSPRIAYLLGYQPEEIIGKTPHLLVDPTERQQVERLFREIAAQQSPLEIFTSTMLHTKTGRQVILETNGVPFYDHQGRFKGYQGISRDVTLRHNYEASLKQSNQRLQRVLDGLDALVRVTSLDQQENFFINAMAQQHLHILPCTQQTLHMDDTLRQSLCDENALIHPDGEPTRRISGEYFHPTEKSWYAVRVLAIRWVDHRLARLEIITDITEKKALQESLRHLKNKLEIEERKRLGNLLHESICQSLQAIKLGLEMKSLVAEQASISLKDEVGELQDCIGQLRDITTVLRPSFLERMNLEEATRWWCHRLSRNWEGTLDLHTSGNFNELDAEITYNLFRILQEGLTNALKHAQAKVLQIELSHVEGEGFTLVVADDGVGMDLAQTRRTAKGLGLSIIYEQAERLGGTAHFTTAPQQGLIIAVRVPEA